MLIEEQLFKHFINIDITAPIHFNITNRRKFRMHQTPCEPTNISYILVYKSIFRVVKREFPEATRLIRTSYFLTPEGKMFSPSLTLNTIGFNPIRARVGIKLSNPCLIIHYYSINNNQVSPNCYLAHTNMPVFM